MVNKAIALNWIKNLLEDLSEAGYQPTEAWLFGSVATGKQHEHSDVDLALWDEDFTGCLSIDYEPIKRILTKYPRLEVHTFHAGEDEKSNPFIGEIKKTGFRLNLSELGQEMVA